MKLRILPFLMKKNLGANMVGDFVNNRIMLRTDKLVGNTAGCIGFVLNDNDGFYHPNTALNIDLRDEPLGYKRMLAIYRKPVDTPRYSECVYLAKKIDVSELNLPPEYRYLTQTCSSDNRDGL